MPRDSRDSRKRGRSRSRSRDRSPRDDRDSRSRRDDRRTTQTKEDEPVDYTALHKTVVVNTDGGEASCSVDETNRMRAALGLKPLRVRAPPGSAAAAGADGDAIPVSAASQDEKAVANMAALKAQQKEERRLGAIESRLEKARLKRVMREQQGTGGRATLGDAAGHADAGEAAAAAAAASSASDWVKRSRSTAADQRKKAASLAEKKLLAAKRAALLSEQDGGGYHASALAGLNVAHGASEIQSGESVVLTIKDAPILEMDETGDLVGVSGEADELEK